MRIIAINGSPRKKWNTATLLVKALEGAASQGAVTDLVHLYDLAYKGCISCFACKAKDGKSYGRCAVEDSLTPLYARIEKADALILGSPIYLGDSVVSGSTKSFSLRDSPRHTSRRKRTLTPRSADCSEQISSMSGVQTSIRQDSNDTIRR